MTELRTDPRRVAVWTAMAQHFLDTETRHEIPLTALACIEAGLSIEQARLTWQDEITPVVGANLFSVAGEWVGWDEKWLVESIARQRRGVALPGPCRWLRYRLVGAAVHGVWVSVARCMALLLAAPDREQRRQLAQDLRFVARHCFDFCPREVAKLEPAQRARLAELEVATVLELFRPALARAEATDAQQRVEVALLRGSGPSDVDLVALRRKFACALRAAGGIADAEPEQRSAELARTELLALGVPVDVCERISEHVLATQHHAAHGDSALVVDIDLAILGAREHDFARFEAQIRNEYAWVSEAEFRAGRCHVLRSFAARSSIYALPALRQELEPRARANLERRIRELS
ncbi:MAG TPA: hypothetical protein VHB79_19425 [Polyangiaceae bacterium]|nr:hypothetical protein [Polyangiaceae bacterium]